MTHIDLCKCRAETSCLGVQHTVYLKSTIQCLRSSNDVDINITATNNSVGTGSGHIAGLRTVQPNLNTDPPN